MEDYMFSAGKVENWNIMIEMACKEFPEIPLKVLSKLFLYNQRVFN